MSEVSVSWRRRSPSARSALPLTRTLRRFQDLAIEAVEKRERRSGKRLFPRKILTQRGFPLLAPREGRALPRQG